MSHFKRHTIICPKWPTSCKRDNRGHHFRENNIYCKILAKKKKKKKKNSKQQLLHKILWRTWISYITVCWLPQGNEIRNTNWLSRANRNFISNKSSLLNRWGGESGKVSQSFFHHWYANSAIFFLMAEKRQLNKSYHNLKVFLNA